MQCISVRKGSSLQSLTSEKCQIRSGERARLFENCSTMLNSSSRVLGKWCKNTRAGKPLIFFYISMFLSQNTVSSYKVNKSLMSLFFIALYQVIDNKGTKFGTREHWWERYIFAHPASNVLKHVLVSHRRHRVLSACKNTFLSWVWGRESVKQGQAQKEKGKPAWWLQMGNS